MSYLYQFNIKQVEMCRVYFRGGGTLYVVEMHVVLHMPDEDGSVAEWLACRTQARKGMGSNRSRDAVG